MACGTVPRCSISPALASFLANVSSSDQIRLLLDECGQTRYRIAKSTGIDEGSLAKFYNGHRGLSMDALDRLAVYLGMRVTLETSKRKGRN